jgi:dTDP-4-dehydrorhamnose reductase
VKILILGESGYAGQAIAQKLDENYEIYGTYNTQTNLYCNNDKMYRLELGNTDTIKSILDNIQPQIVISCLRGDFQLQLDVHSLIANYLTDKNDGRIIYISTANVFDAKSKEPHYELNKTASKTDYGNFKIKCEQMLQDKLGDKCIVIRVPQIWGKDCPRILKLIEDTKKSIPIITYPNVYANYTSNIQIAEWIEYIIKKDLRGIFHIGTQDTYDYMQFQLELSRALGLNEPVFEKELITEKCFQAVLPGRMEIPDNLQMKVIDLLKYLKEVQK